MMFLVSTAKGKFESYGASYHLEPITYPEVNISNILVVEDSLGKRILRTCPHMVQAIFQAEKTPGFPSRHARIQDIRENSKVIILRGGGIGDLILFLPALKVFKRMLPGGVKLSLATFREKMSLFRGLDDIDELLPMPIRMSDIIGTDYCVEFSSRFDLFRTIHMTDYYLTLMGIEPESIEKDLKEPRLSIKSAGSVNILQKIEGLKKRWEKVIYVNTGATDIIRRLPPEVIVKTARYFPQLAFLLPSQLWTSLQNPSPNLLPIDTEGSLEAYTSAIMASDAVISSDSSAYHIAAAFRKPAIAIFGPVASRLRTAYYSTVHPIDAQYLGQVCQSPCGLSAVTELAHSNLSPYFKSADRCPEAVVKGTHYSPCLLSVSVDRIIEAFSKVIACN